MNEPRSAIAKGPAAPPDPCAIFNDQIDHLYTLALLLTGDHQQAERCCVAGLEDCLEGRPLAQEWAESWARRMIVNNAIKMVSPRPDGARFAENAQPAGKTRQPFEAPPDSDGLVTVITGLRSFERFVYVMSVLEGYSSGTCAMLLHCKVTDVANARIRALQQLARGLPLDLEGLTDAAELLAVSECD